MSKEEMALALQLILEDIRGNWGGDLEERVDVAFYLATQLSKNDNVYLRMIASINGFKEDMKTEWCDGRYFRTSFPNGYNGMDSLHNIPHTNEDKSDEFKDAVSCLTYPEYRFEDYK